MPLVLLLVLVTAPSQPEGPRSMPEGLHATRVSGGVVELQTVDGTPIPGEVKVGVGWYVTPVGYERFMQDSMVVQSRMEKAEAQVDAYRQATASIERRMEQALERAESCQQLAVATCSAAAAEHAGYSAQSMALVAGMCLLLGMALGPVFAPRRAETRPER